MFCIGAVLQHQNGNLILLRIHDPVFRNSGSGVIRAFVFVVSLARLTTGTYDLQRKIKMRRILNIQV